MNCLYKLISLDAAEIMESLVKILVDRMLDAKENVDGKLVASLCNGDTVIISCTCNRNHVNKWI
jgi:hypothetical protein